MHCWRIVNVIKNKNIKNSLWATWNASHLAVRLCALRHWKRVSMPPTTQSHPPPTYEGPPHCPKDKHRSPFHDEKPLIVKWFLEKRLYLPKTILYGRDAILRVRIKWLIFNIILQLWADLLGLVFRRRRAVFILLAMPPPSLGRAALGVWCGWFKPRLEIRHATALTTGAKHWHRQKAVLYVFVSVPPVFIHCPPNI